MHVADVGRHNSVPSRSSSRRPTHGAVSDGMFYVEQTDLRFCAGGHDDDGPGAPLDAAVHNTFVVVTSRFAAPPP